jgi:hypothetical protein
MKTIKMKINRRLHFWFPFFGVIGHKAKDCKALRTAEITTIFRKIRVMALTALLF